MVNLLTQPSRLSKANALAAEASEYGASALPDMVFTAKAKLRKALLERATRIMEFMARARAMWESQAKATRCMASSAFAITPRVRGYLEPTIREATAYSAADGEASSGRAWITRESLARARRMPE